ncbi:MAG: hypothetical protein H0Z29_11490 [Candidatus Marinimicrobia bacterium]|nr:hypothetical protein [Candidatus Neomarinimicrobiota bacterium]
MRTDGGEAYKLTNHSGGVVNYKWGKNSNTIFFVAIDSLTKFEKERKEKKDDEIILDYNYKSCRLYEIDIQSREIKLLTEDKQNVNDFGWEAQ